jgi:hypothetical protein
MIFDLPQSNCHFLKETGRSSAFQLSRKDSLWSCLAQLIFSFFTNLSRSSTKQTASAAASQFSCFSK